MGNAADVADDEAAEAEEPAQAQAGEDEDTPKKSKYSKAGYETQYWSFIADNWPGLFASFSAFDSAIRLRHKLDECGAWADIRSYFEDHCQYTDPRLANKNGTILHLLADVATFFGSLPTLHMDLMFQVFKNCVPTNDAVPWRLVTRRDVQKLAPFKVEMSNAKAYTPRKAKPLESLQSSPQPSSSAKGKAKGPKGKSKSKSKARAKKPVMEEFNAISVDGEKEWATMMCDDIRNCINFTLRGIKDSDVRKEAVAQCWQWAIEFVIHGRVWVSVQPIAEDSKGDEEISVFTALRRFMQKHLAEAHRGVASEPDPAEKPAAASQDDAPPSQPVCEALLEASRIYDADNKFLQTTIHDILAANPDMLKFNPLQPSRMSFMRRSTKSISEYCFDLLCQIQTDELKKLGDVSKCIASITEVMANIIWKVLPGPLLEFASKLFEATQEDRYSGDLDAYFQAAKPGANLAWKTTVELEHFLQLRAAMSLLFVDEAVDYLKLAITENPHTSTVLAEVVNHFKIFQAFSEHCAADIAAVDASFTMKSSWAAGWSSMLARAQGFVNGGFKLKTAEEWAATEKVVLQEARTTPVPFLAARLAKATPPLDASGMSNEERFAAYAKLKLEELKQTEARLADKWKSCLAEARETDEDESNDIKHQEDSLESVLAESVVAGAAGAVASRAGKVKVDQLFLMSLPKCIEDHVIAVVAEWVYAKAKENLVADFGLRARDSGIFADFGEHSCNFCLPLVGKVRVYPESMLQKGLRVGYTICHMPSPLTGYSENMVCVMLPSKAPAFPEADFASLWKLHGARKGGRTSCVVEDKAYKKEDESVLKDLPCGSAFTIKVLVKNPEFILPEVPLSSKADSLDSRMYELTVAKTWSPEMTIYSQAQVAAKATKVLQDPAEAEEHNMNKRTATTAGLNGTDSEDEGPSDNISMPALSLDQADLAKYYRHILK